MFLQEEGVHVHPDGNIVSRLVDLDLGKVDPLESADIARGLRMGQLRVAGEENLKGENEVYARLAAWERERQQTSTKCDIKVVPT